VLFFIVVVTGEDSVEKAQKVPFRGCGRIERKGIGPVRDARPGHDQGAEIRFLTQKM